MTLYWNADERMEMLRKSRMQIIAWFSINTLHVNEREIYITKYNHINVTLLNYLSSVGQALGILASLDKMYMQMPVVKQYVYHRYVYL